jgi:conjugal transfer pilus assembly protein TraK
MMRLHRRLKTVALVVALAGAAPALQAEQLIDARDGVTAEAAMSIREPTRIRIEGAPIKDVFGNIYLSDCPAAAAPALPGSPAVASPPSVNPAGEVVIQCDRDKGEIYVRPVGNTTKPVNLFISSADATYTLLLRRVDTPADTIVIRDRGARTGHGDAEAGPTGLAPGHVRALKVMLVMMASDRVPNDVSVDEVGQPVTLWAESRFSLMRRYTGRGLVGEKYLLTNVSAKPMVLAEQEFDREGVYAVAIENHNLRPGDSTNVYVIRGGD